MKFLRFLAPLLLVPSLALAGVWNDAREGAAGENGVIQDSSAPSTIDDHIRNDRQQVRKRAAVEHFWGSGDGLDDDNGLHRQGSARCFVQASAPTSLNSAGGTGLADYLNSSEDEFGGATDFNDFASLSAEAIRDDVGHGRCWFDSDDNYRLYIYQGVAGNNTPSTIAEGWEPANQIDSDINLVHNPSFEMTDGDGVLTATTGTPVGWTDTAGPATYVYIDHSEVTEGDGYGVKTDTGASTDEGITQIITGLLPSTQYRAQVRVKAAGSDTCQIKSVNHGSVIPSAAEAETTGEVFETLQLLITTDSTPTDITLQLVGPDAEDECTWDHVSFVKVAPQLHRALPHMLIFEEDNTTTPINMTNSYVTKMTLEVTAPGPNYYITFFFSSYYISDGAACYAQVWDGSAEVYQFIYNTSGTDNLMVTFSYPVTTPAVSGATVTYELRMKDGTGDCTAGSRNIFKAILHRGG